MAGREHSSGGGSVSRSGTCGYGGAPTEGSGGSAFGIHVQSYREDANSAPALAPGQIYARFKFAGTTSWDQYRQVFEAIVISNGWDGATAVLQLLSHLEGDALNVALLVPAPRRALPGRLVDALAAHYGSPGRLTDYQRQFEKVSQTAGTDPSIFAIELETMVMKAFGDMSQMARIRLVRDRFMARQDSCALRRHLDSVAPETPKRDIVDRCCVWESHADLEGQRGWYPNPRQPLPVYAINNVERVMTHPG